MFFFKIFSFFSFNKRNSLLHNIIILNIFYSPFFISFFYVKIKQIMSEYKYVNNLIKSKKNINNIYKNNNNIINYNNSYIIKELYDHTFQGFYITNIDNKEIKGKIKIIFRKEFYNLYFLDVFLYKNNQDNIFLISNTFPFNKNYSFSIKKENKNLFNIKTVNDIIFTSLNKHLFNFKKKYNFGNIFLYYNISNINDKLLLGYFDINGIKFFFSTNNDKHSLINQLNIIGKIILLLSILQFIINFLIFDVTLLDKYEAIKYSSYSIIINFLSLSLILIQSLCLSFIDKVRSKFIIIFFYKNREFQLYIG